MRVVKDFYNTYGTNSYLIYDEDSKEAYIIDAPSMVLEFDKIIKEKKLNVSYLLLTHGHYDHIVYANELRDKYGLKIVAHEKEKGLLEDSSLNLSKMFKGIDLTVKADIFLKDDGNFENKFDYIWSPGHTMGGVSYIIDGKIFTGDSIFKESIGRTDFPTGDYNLLINTIVTKLLTLDDDMLIYPGHGPNTRVSYEKQYNPFIR